MKRDKINIRTIIIIGIIISMFFIIINMKNNNIVKQEIKKEQLVETTTENTYVKMQTHLLEVNDKEQKLLSFKSEIASAITDMGVTTAEDADATTMASNIRDICSNKEIKHVTVSSQGNWITISTDSKPKFIFVMVQSTSYNMAAYYYNDTIVTGGRSGIQNVTDTSFQVIQTVTTSQSYNLEVFYI